MSAMVEQERTKKMSDKYAKVKTEQQYMQDNFRLMRRSRGSSQGQGRGWAQEEKEHPFVRLLDQEQTRKR